MYRELSWILPATIVIALGARISRAEEDTRPTIDELYVDRPNGGWLTPQELQEVLREAQNTPAKQDPFEAFLRSRAGLAPKTPETGPVAVDLKTLAKMYRPLEDPSKALENDASTLSSSTPVARIYLLANTGRLVAAAKEGDAYLEGPIFQRFTDGNAVAALTRVNIELGKLDRAEKLVLWQTTPTENQLPGFTFRRDPAQPTNKPPGKDPLSTFFDPELRYVSERIEKYGVLALLTGHKELFVRLSRPVREFLEARARTDPTGRALVSLGFIEAVEGKLSAARLHLQNGLDKVRDHRERESQQYWHEHCRDMGWDEATHPRPQAPGDRDISPATFLATMILNSWDLLQGKAKLKFAADAFDHEAMSGFSESFDVVVPSAAREIGFTRREDRRLAAVYQLLPGHHRELATPTLEYLLNSRRLRCRSTKLFASRPPRPVFDEVTFSLHGQAAGMHFFVFSPGECERRQKQIDWLLERSSRGLERPIGLLYSYSVRTRTDDDVAHDSPQWKNISEFAAALPPRTAALEFIKGSTIDFDRLEQGLQFTPECYGAWLLTKSGQPVFVNVGRAAEIDPLIADLRRGIHGSLDALRNSGKDDPQVAVRLRQLSDRLLKPIESQLAGVEHLIICPDGELWLLPWAALPMQDGRLLLEHCAVSHRFTAGAFVDEGAAAPRLLEKALAGMGVAAPRALDRALIFANPDFNATPADVREAEVAMLHAEQRDAIRIPARGARPLLSPAVALPATALEAEAAVPRLRELTGREPYVYSGANAIESLVKSLHSPEYLVFATHGVFLPSPANESGADPGPSPEGYQSLDLTDPLVRSAILLAGANQCGKWGEVRGSEGILSALEVALLDLRGTKLVVLSACDTGVGELRYGDGVSGLREAFFMAGSRAVAATLWRVEDKATYELTANLLANLAAGDPTRVALRKAQLHQLAKCRKLFYSDCPFFWAAFTLTEQ